VRSKHESSRKDHSSDRKLGGYRIGWDCGGDETRKDERDLLERPRIDVLGGEEREREREMKRNKAKHG